MFGKRLETHTVQTITLGQYFLFLSAGQWVAKCNMLAHAYCAIVLWSVQWFNFDVWHPHHWTNFFAAVLCNAPWSHQLQWILLSEWYSLILNPSVCAIDSKCWALCVVPLALLEYCEKLNILPLAWSTNKLPHLYPRRFFQNVCRMQPWMGEKKRSAEIQLPGWRWFFLSAWLFGKG